MPEEDPGAEARRLREHLAFHLQDLYANEQAIAAISNRYLGGAELLFDEERADLSESIGKVEEIIASFNRVIAPDLLWRQRLEADDLTGPQPSPLLDPAAIRERSAAQTEVIRSFHVDHARALTLDDCGHGEQARALMVRYIRGPE